MKCIHTYTTAVPWPFMAPARGPGTANGLAMNLFRAAVALAVCVSPGLVRAGNNSPSAVPPGNGAAEWNVNSRYTVEAVEFTDTDEGGFSHRLREEIRTIAGDKLNVGLLRRVAHDVQSELSAHRVSFRIARGSRPDYVRVFFDVDRNRPFDISVPKFLWQSNGGWTGVGEATLTAANNTFTVGVLSDNDDLVERFTGVRARVAHRWGLDHPVRLIFDFEDYHEAWGPATVSAIAETPGAPETDHARRNIAPQVEYALSRSLTVAAGASLEMLQSILPGQHPTAANAMTAQMRWRRAEEGSDEHNSKTQVTWSLRAATHSLGSDYVYARNEITGSWTGTWGPQSLEALGVAGLITGDAPMFERFLLGNSEMLRGWNRFELDPLGGSRLAYGSLEYRYRILRAFYDVGAIWDPRDPISPKQSVGAGIGSGFGILGRNELLIALAFPLRDGRMDPVLIAGMNF